MQTKKITISIILVVLISVIVYSQNYIEAHKFKKNEMLYFVPKEKHLAYTNFGFKPVIADLLWLRGVSYFMFHLGTDNDYKYLFGMFNASVTLDPRFKQVYRDVMVLLLSDKEYYPDAEKLILKGINNLPEDWEIYYMAGILYTYYIKDEIKSLKYLERCWNLIPKNGDFQKELQNVNILIRVITEKRNDKSTLVLYWVNKYNEQLNKESKEFCVLQIKKYFSLLMVEKINEVVLRDIQDAEKNKLLSDAMDHFVNFYNRNKLNDFIEVPLDDLFSKKDAFGFPWVFSQQKKQFYSFGCAQEYLNRKINLFNIKLWEKLEKYLEKSVNELLSYYPDERKNHIRLKPSYSQFPAFEEIYNEKEDWLKLEYPLFPIYDRAAGCFRVPEYKDLNLKVKIEK